MSKICEKNDPEMNVNVLEIVREWNSVALENRVNEDPSSSIFNFMTYWVAFNLLCNEKNYIYIKGSNNNQKYIFKNNIPNPTNDKNENEKELYKLFEKKYTQEFLEVIISTNNQQIDTSSKNEKQKILLYVDSIINKLIEPDVFDKIINCCNTIRTQPIVEGIESYTYQQLKDKCERKKSTKNITKDKDYQSKVLYEYLKVLKTTNEQKIMALMMIVYQIRCNLFHGGKRPDYKRDCTLVSEAAKIMKIVIDTVLSDKEVVNNAE